MLLIKHVRYRITPLDRCHGSGKVKLWRETREGRRFYQGFTGRHFPTFRKVTGKYLGIDVRGRRSEGRGASDVLGRGFGNLDPRLDRFDGLRYGQLDGCCLAYLDLDLSLDISAALTQKLLEEPAHFCLLPASNVGPAGYPMFIFPPLEYHITSGSHRFSLSRAFSTTQ